VEAVGNPVLSMLMKVLSTRTQRARIVRDTRAERAVEHAHREHEAILRALRARDAALAVSAATVHVAALEQWMADGLDEDPLCAIGD
jgi:DNA-binding FadR family transcriptional regulator